MIKLHFNYFFFNSKRDISKSIQEKSAGLTVLFCMLTVQMAARRRCMFRNLLNCAFNYSDSTQLYLRKSVTPNQRWKSDQSSQSHTFSAPGLGHSQTCLERTVPELKVARGHILYSLVRFNEELHCAGFMELSTENKAESGVTIIQSTSLNINRTSNS